VWQQEIRSLEPVERQIVLCYPEFPIEFYASKPQIAAWNLGRSPNQSPGLSGTGRRKRERGTRAGGGGGGLRSSSLGSGRPGRGRACAETHPRPWWAQPRRRDVSSSGLSPPVLCENFANMTPPWEGFKYLAPPSWQL
jgi:hypothetical protein